MQSNYVNINKLAKTTKKVGMIWGILSLVGAVVFFFVASGGEEMEGLGALLFAMVLLIIGFPYLIGAILISKHHLALGSIIMTVGGLPVMLLFIVGIMSMFSSGPSGSLDLIIWWGILPFSLSFPGLLAFFLLLRIMNNHWDNKRVTH